MLLSCFASKAQHIAHFMKMLNAQQYRTVELPANDSIVSDRYFEYIRIDTFHTGTIDTISHFQSSVFKFNNTTLVGITDWDPDMQCSFYHTSFYEYDKTHDSLRRIPNEKIFPGLSYHNFIKDEERLKKMIDKYLPAIKAEYLPDDAGYEKVLEEFYSYHFIMPTQRSEIEVRLHVCDYIPVNVVNIAEEDWRIVEDTKTITLKYNRKKKAFVVK